MWVYNSAVFMFPDVYLARGGIYKLRDSLISRVVVEIGEIHILLLLGPAVRGHLLGGCIDHLGDLGIQ